MLKIHRYQEGLHVVTYRAILDVPRELVAYLAALLAAERRTRGTRAGTRALSCHKQAVFALVWFRERRPTPLIGRDRGISQATSYRYLTEAVDVLAAQAPTCTRRCSGSPTTAGRTSSAMARSSVVTGTGSS